MVAAAHAILEDSTKWKNGKRFHKVVQTFGRPKGPTDGAAWHGRVSEHDASDATFDEFWSKLGVDHSENEKLCVCTPSRARGRTYIRVTHWQTSVDISRLSKRSLTSRTSLPTSRYGL